MTPEKSVVDPPRGLRDECSLFNLYPAASLPFKSNRRSGLLVPGEVKNVP